MSVHREGENPSSMDGVPDLRDHNSIQIVLIKVSDITVANVTISHQKPVI